MTYFEKIVDVFTGEETLRPFTDDESTALDAEQALAAAEQAERETEQSAKAAARQVVLDKLGLTADEVAALLGGN